jgi:hypothetical protein
MQTQKSSSQLIHERLVTIFQLMAARALGDLGGRLKPQVPINNYTINIYSFFFFGKFFFRLITIKICL